MTPGRPVTFVVPRVSGGHFGLGKPARSARFLQNSASAGLLEGRPHSVPIPGVDSDEEPEATKARSELFED